MTQAGAGEGAAASGAGEGAFAGITGQRTAFVAQVAPYVPGRASPPGCRTGWLHYRAENGGH